MLRGNFIAVNILRKKEKFKINDKIFHLMQPIKDEQFIQKLSKRKKIIMVIDIKNRCIF